MTVARLAPATRAALPVFLAHGGLSFAQTRRTGDGV